LVDPLAGFEAEYEATHPAVDLRIEGHGSIQAIRQVTDLDRPVDVVAVADASLIPDLMAGRTASFTTFGTTEMVIAYTNASRYAGEISESNWADVLARPDVRVGIANPMLDAAGYRAMLLLLLAEREGSAPVFGPVLGDHLSPPLAPTPNGSGLELRLPEVVRPAAGGKVAIRDGSVFLLSLLEAGGIDYAFEYRSVAEARGLPYVRLPPSVNLGPAGPVGAYSNATVHLGFQRFSAIGTERGGLPIVYAVTVPASAPHPEEAREFADALVRVAGEGRTGWPEPLPPATVALGAC
ncbi:MAG TPA: tungstate ABC transporter substrate-binding protein WtpA, partial [Methanoregulaceae archaeon]|nr:tungstate ABC transporter substrate-binding protein WtpA [Methanoregulaceae archaeon]